LSQSFQTFVNFQFFGKFDQFIILYIFSNTLQWVRINCKQSARWQHLSQLKASAFFSLQKN
jgi:hypothetical protein